MEGEDSKRTLITGDFSPFRARLLDCCAGKSQFRNCEGVGSQTRSYCEPLSICPPETETRPIYHRRDETIRGHVFCGFLALLLRRALGEHLEKKGETWEWAEIVRGLDNLQEVEALFQGKRFVLRSQVIGQVHKAFMAAGVVLPPTLGEKA